MYSNDLIYGKNKIENIVSVEAVGDKLKIFREVDGQVSCEELPNKFWFITNRKISSKQIEMEGNQYFRHIGLFDTQVERDNVIKLLKQKNIDHYKIYDPKESSMLYHGITYYKGLNPKDISILATDIETTGLTHDDNSKVLLIANTFRKKGITIRKLFAHDEYASQAEMIVAWCKWVRSIDPSIVCGHNLFGFDIPYLQYIATREGISLDLGRDGSAIRFSRYTSKFRKDGSQDIDYVNCYIFGREIVDTMFLAIKYDIERKYTSYQLKTIIAEEKLEKKDRTFYPAEEIRYKYHIPEEWEKIKSYARDDGDDALALFDFMVSAYFYFTQSVSKAFQTMINSATGSQINNMMVRAYLQENHSIALATEAEKYEGAISFGIPGIYSNCFKQDVSSLYPSIMRQYQVYNKQKDPKKYFLAMVEYFTIERLKNKKLAKETNNPLYKGLEKAQKVAINSMYGFLGTAGLNYNYPAGAAFVTAKGREILSAAIEFATSKTVSYWQSLIKPDENGEEHAEH